MIFVKERSISSRIRVNIDDTIFNPILQLESTMIVLSWLEETLLLVHSKFGINFENLLLWLESYSLYRPHAHTEKPIL